MSGTADTTKVNSKDPIRNEKGEPKDPAQVEEELVDAK